MSAFTDFLAVDLGASNGRVFVGRWNGNEFSLSELYRFANRSVKIPGGLHWDVLRLWSEIIAGMCKYSAQFSSSPAGASVDAWGVDFALLDDAGGLQGNPHSYRDSRTDGVQGPLFALVGGEEIFRCTGVRPIQINTLFQLFSMVQTHDSHLEEAHSLLMMADLFNYWLCGEKAIEQTAASTTEMLLKGHREWAVELLERLGIPTSILAPVSAPASILSPVRCEVAKAVGFSSRVPVIAGASHDTACAEVAVPEMDSASVFISSGTWSIVGVEVDEPLVTNEAFDLGFTNEAGANGRTLLQRNLRGLWLLQECMRQWQLIGQVQTWEEMLALAQGARPFRSLVQPEHRDFLDSVDMHASITSYCDRTDQPQPDSVGAVARCCLESLSLCYRLTLDALLKLLGRPLNVIRVVGGGCQNAMLCQFTANACQRPVVAGPIEASALGNVIMQAIAVGCIPDVATARRVITASVRRRSFEPESCDGWEEAYDRFRRLENYSM